MKYTINVTEDDIRKGQIGNCDACPVALALQRAIGRRWIYTYGRVVDAKGAKTHLCELPEIATQFIKKFDSAKKVNPIQFEIEIKDL